MNLNWKYNQWAKKQNCEFNGIDTYISQNIEAEDIEIFSNILCPKTIEYKGGVILSWWAVSNEDIEEIKSTFDRGLQNFLSISEAEKAINDTRLYDVFFNTSQTAHNETYQNVAKLIQKNWEYHLMTTYPDKKFIVEIGGEYEQFGVTFYQAL